MRACIWEVARECVTVENQVGEWLLNFPDGLSIGPPRNRRNKVWVSRSRRCHTGRRGYLASVSRGAPVVVGGLSLHSSLGRLGQPGMPENAPTN